MKLHRKSRFILSATLVAIASIFAVASYFDVEMSQLGEFMIGTLLFFGGILVLAVCAVALLKLAGVLMRRFRKEDDQDDAP